MQKGLAPILIVVLIALALGGYLIYQRQTKPIPAPQLSTQPSLTPAASPAQNDASETANWKTYTSSKYNYSVKFPPNLEADDKYNGDYSTLFNLIQTKPSGPSFPTFYTSVVPDGFWQNGAIYNYPKADFLTILFSIPVGQSKAIYPGDLAQWNTWIRLSDTTVDGNNASVFENSQVWEYGGKEKRVFVKKTGFTYMIGSYYQTDDESKNLNSILSTFKFTK